MRPMFAAALIGLLVACTPPQPKSGGIDEAPLETVRAAYAVQDGALDDFFAPDLLAADKAVTEASLLLQEPLIDMDPRTGAQDPIEGPVTVTYVEPPEAGVATVQAAFMNGGEETVATVRVVQVDGRWAIDDIATPAAGSYREALTTALTPIGPPDAMIAPVKAIYDRYAQGIEPLAGFAALSPELKTALLAAPRGADAAFVRAQEDGEPVAPSYSAVAGAVVAQFEVAGEPKAVAFLLQQDQPGVYVIAAIRAAGNDLETSLAQP